MVRYARFSGRVDHAVSKLWNKDSGLNADTGSEIQELSRLMKFIESVKDIKLNNTGSNKPSPPRKPRKV
jgi:hypothetical protein